CTPKRSPGEVWKRAGWADIVQRMWSCRQSNNQSTTRGSGINPRPNGRSRATLRHAAETPVEVIVLPASSIGKFGTDRIDTLGEGGRPHLNLRIAVTHRRHHELTRIEG